MSTMSSTNEHGQGASHATGDSVVPDKVQDVAPKGLEKSLPDTVHDTSSSTSGNQGAHSHATGPSKVPEAIQKVAPEGLERALPESIHPTK
ncbi:MAG: hypothetical protein Q9187_006008 [Circinaria calcarea]